MSLELRSREAQTVEAIRQRIAEGIYPPAGRLTEIGVSQELGLSRGTVRSAFGRLASEGLMRLEPYRGWSVVPLSATGAWELYSVRYALEPLASALAAARIAEIDTAPIVDAFARLEAASAHIDTYEIAVADGALHLAIVAAAGHERLAQQYTDLGVLMRLYIESSDALVPGTHTVAAQHRPLVEAVLAGDVDTARAEAAAHVLSEGRALVAHLAEEEGVDAAGILARFDVIVGS